MPRPQHPSTQCRPREGKINPARRKHGKVAPAPRDTCTNAAGRRGAPRPLRAPAREARGGWVSQGKPQVPLPFPPLASGLTCEVLGEDQGDQQDGDEHGADGDHAVKRQLQRAAAAARPARPPCRPARRAGSARAASPGQQRRRHVRGRLQEVVHKGAEDPGRGARGGGGGAPPPPPGGVGPPGPARAAGNAGSAAPASAAAPARPSGGGGGGTAPSGGRRLRSRRGEGAVYLRRLAAAAPPPTPTPARRCGAGDDLAKIFK